MTEPQCPCPFEPARRLLVVDDDLDIAQSLCLLLADPQVTIDMARNGIEAIARARTFRPHLILLDVAMPIMDGFEAFRVIHGDPELNGTKVIFLTAHAQRGALELAVDMGATGFMRKPFDMDLLRHKVFTALGLAGGDDADAADPSDPLPPRTRSHAPMRPFQVVVVDRDPATAEAIEGAIGSTGQPTTIRRFALGMAALKELASSRPDAIVVERDVPDIDGLTLVRLIRRNLKLAEVPVIVVSAQPPEAEAPSALYVQKPLDRVALLEALRKTPSGRSVRLPTTPASPR